MRYHFFDSIRDQLGNVVPSASVYIYLAGTVTAASIYTVNSGGAALAVAPQITTDNNGWFEFWVDDEDYDHDQKFKLNVVKTGFTTVTIDYINIFPILTNFLQTQDANGDDWYHKPDSVGGLMASKTKSDIT